MSEDIRRQVIQKFREIHGNRYDYSKVEYKSLRTLITIICPLHGEFKKFPKAHKRGVGCPNCII